jgi:GH15 family glucan-1,4-alpha-glucosidase
MSTRLEDYGVLGDTQTAALVSRQGSIDWLCLPRFDSGACFAALLGHERHGRWALHPTVPVRQVTRRYRHDTNVLETELSCDGGKVRLIDCMPPRGRGRDVVRIVEGVAGEVPFALELIARFDYGATVPAIEPDAGGLALVAGPNALRLRAGVPVTVGDDDIVRASFTVRHRQRVPFVLTWYPSFEAPPPEVDPEVALRDAEADSRRWISRCTYHGPYEEAVRRSLLALKLLTYRPTGGIVAAATASLPEALGGVRNWDYRFCWLRDASLTLDAFLRHGFHDEAVAWRNWLMRAVAGAPDQLQTLYGVAGERRQPEVELDWLPGYEGSSPMRVGNAAVDQFQLDVYGELMECMFLAERAGARLSELEWQRQLKLIAHVEKVWNQPDEGIWEVRGGRRHFVYSKMMAWLVFDRAVRFVTELGRTGPVDRWRAVGAEIHRQLCERGFDRNLGAFTQSYGSTVLDASVLQMPRCGFLPASDARVRSTVQAIERKLLREGLVERYDTSQAGDGLPPGEGVFLACSFWLVSAYALDGRLREAEALFQRLLGLRNDLGLLSEEYDPDARRLVGNFPQAFSHLALLNSVLQLERATAAHAGRGGELHA